MVIFAVVLLALAGIYLVSLWLWPYAPSRAAGIDGVGLAQPAPLANNERRT
jgi:hypothetical protein